MRDKIIIFANTDDAGSIRRAQARLGTLAKGKWKIEVKPIGNTRSLSANAYWWSVIVEMFRLYNEDQDEHYSPQQCHDILKRELLPVKIRKCPVSGRSTIVLSDTHTMSREEFGLLIERAIAYLAQMGIVCPDPHAMGYRRSA